MARWMKAFDGHGCAFCDAEADWKQSRYVFGEGYSNVYFCADCRRKALSERQQVERDKGGYVYALQCGPWIKIGTSYTPERRMKAIDAVCPPTEGLYILNGGHALEKELHERLKAHRVKNEWFEASTEVLATLQQIWRAQSGKQKSDAAETQLRLVG